MDEQTQPATRRAKTHEQIDRLLAERDSTLVLLWKVSGRDDNDPHAPDQTLLAEFTTLLTDYIAAGDFGLFQRVAEGTERRQAVLTVAAQTYPRISETTRIAVDFSDRYSDRAGAHLDPRLPEDLVTLGEALAERIGLEDELIAAMRRGKGAHAAA
ncbi:MAG: Rsd/AlgQ family anti-sigma factor [Gammaproteobacteria bacterium]